MTRRAGVLTAVLGLASLLAVAPAAPAQRRVAPAADGNPFLNGMHAFRRILYDVGGRNKLTPLSGVKGRLDPESTLIIVLGDPAPLVKLDASLLGGLRSWVEDGGALLIATDKPTPDVLRVNFDVGVKGTEPLLTLPGGGPQTYRGMPECPFVEPMKDAGPPFVERSVRLANPPAKRIASNLPSYLAPCDETSLPLLAVLPRECIGNRGAAPPWKFAAGGPLGVGRMLVMADHSVFINSMMLQNDNGNLDFAYRCADWLLTRPAGHSGRRDRILFYEDGVVQTNFNIPLRDLPPLPLPPPATLMGMLDETLFAMEQDGTFTKMEEDDVLNDSVEGVMATLPLWKWATPENKIWTLLVIVATAVLSIYGFLRLGAFRQRHDTSGPLLADVLRKQGPAGTALAQRQEALLRDGNLWEVARDLARHLFVSAGLVPDTGLIVPTLTVTGSCWRRWRMQWQWRKLWRLARSARPVRVSPRGFARLARQVRGLQVALADGSVSIIPSSTTNHP